MFFILGGSGCPPMFVHPHTFICPQGCTHTTTCPPYSCASVCSQRLLHIVGVVRGCLFVGHLYTSPCMGVPPIQLTPPTHSLASLCISMFWGYLYVIWGFFPYVGGLEGCSPISWGFRGISTWHVHMLILVHFCNLLCLIFLQL